jgi:UDP-2-acetamido-2,6-beta-L-arabino-hexul-4-ose reductase
MKSLVLGSTGFIGLNLCNALIENGLDFCTVPSNFDEDELSAKLIDVDFVFHLAGVNRLKNVWESFADNETITQKLANVLARAKSRVPVMFASSIQADQENEYGKSKLNSENILINLSRCNGNPVVIYRFGNLFGRWSRPNHNSVVATFCHNTISGAPLKIHYHDKRIELTDIDSVIRMLLTLLEKKMDNKVIFQQIIGRYSVDVGEIAKIITGFKNKFNSLSDFDPGSLESKLFETYVSFIKPEIFSQNLASKSIVHDFLTPNPLIDSKPSLSFLTVRPGGLCLGKDLGVTRAAFLLLQGEAFLKTNGNFEQSDNGFLRLDRVGGDVIIPAVNALEIRNPGVDELVCLFWKN